MGTKKKNKDVSVGVKIKKIRTERKLTHENLANETGFSVEQIQSIESGAVIPSVGNLLQLAKALRVDSGFLLRDEEQSLENRKEAYIKRTENYAYESLTGGAENKHLKAFKVLIDPRKMHEGVGYCHEGEEFVYVIKGSIEIMVGDHKNSLNEGESLHFNSGIKHQITNISGKATEMIVVIYSP